jgi:hypothetical protein
MGPVGLETKKLCAGEGHQQSTIQSKYILRYTDWSVTIILLGGIFRSVYSYSMMDFLLRLLKLLSVVVGYVIPRYNVFCRYRHLNLLPLFPVLKGHLEIYVRKSSD